MDVTVTLPGAGAGVAATQLTFAVVAAQGRTYLGQPADLKGRFSVVMVENDISENLQWTPGYKTAAGVGGGALVDPLAPETGAANAPYNFIDINNPSSPSARPVARVPLYWGNSYRVRVGLTNANGQYCGSIGQWPAGRNSRNTPPTLSDITAARTAALASAPGSDPNDIQGLFGCTDYIEQNDRWTIPVPTQVLPHLTADNGYPTIAAQTASNPFIDPASGIVRFAIPGSAAANADLVFTGVALPTDWVNSCVQGLEASIGVQFPCGWRESTLGTVVSAQRYNPDPQVWQITASGTQPARLTAIGVGVTPSAIASPPVLIDVLGQTNDIAVWFTYPAMTVARTAATGIPAQPIIMNVPRCEPTGTFVPITDGAPAAPANLIGLQFFPSCNQGLITASCTTAQATTNANCGNSAATTPPTPNLAQAAGSAFGVTLTAITSSDATGNAATPTVPAVGSRTALSGIYIAQSPLQILFSGSNAVLNAGGGSSREATLNAFVRQASLPFTVGFPLNAAADGKSGNSISDNYWNTGAATTSTSNVTIDPIAVFECPAAGCLQTGVLNANYRTGVLTDFFGSTIPSIVVSQSSPTGVLSFAGLPRPTNGNTWRMYFRVTDSVGAGPAAYESIPYITITVNNVEVALPNFPPQNGIFYITQPNSASPNHYHYQMHIAASPTALGLQTVTVGYTISPPSAAGALTFYVDNAQVNSFVFTGTQTTIDFLVYTSPTPVSSFAITFNDSNNIPLDFLPNGGSSLSVRANPISVKTQSSAIQGPFVGEPFYFELTFSPPATSTFTISAAAGSLAAGSATTVTVNVGDTGVLMGPLIPILPSNLANDAANFQLPVALRVEGTSAYIITSVVTLTVFRHTLVTTNAITSSAYNAGTLTVWSTGQASPSFCITSAYPLLQNNSFVGATDTLTLTFYSVFTGTAGTTPNNNNDNFPGLMFSPATVSLSSAQPRQCVSISADRSWNWESLDVQTTIAYSVGAYLGGRLAPMFQNPTAIGTNAGSKNIWDFPHTVTVKKPQVTAVLDASPFAAANTYLLGESVLLRVYTDVLPPVGLNYTVRAPGATIVPVTSSVTSAAAGTGRFAAATSGAPGQWQAWNVTFGGYAGDIDGAAGARSVPFTLYLSSADAQFYSQTDPNPLLSAVSVLTTVTVVKRTVDVVSLPTTLTIGSSSVGYVRVNQPVVRDLTVNLTAVVTGSTASSGVVISPSTFTFTPTSANSFAFTVTGQLLGDYQVAAQLSGSDVDIFDLSDADSNWQTITVTKRTAITFSNGDLTAESGLAAGVRYGPVTATLSSVLLSGESITVTPWAGDFVFTPTSITLGAGQSQAVFSFVAPSIPGTANTRIFWSVTGPDAWKYDVATGISQDYSVAARTVSVTLQGSAAVVPGVAHEGFVTIPLPATADLTIIPASLNGAVSFNPAVWTFGPTTGTALHFTYTVNAAQAFALSEAANLVGANNAPTNPDVDGVALLLNFLVNGTDAIFYNPIVTATVTMKRPAFHMDATYAATNPNEQNSGFFVVGKWSPWYSISLSGAPASGTVTLSLTDSQSLIEFEVDGATTATTRADLSFSADSYVQTMRFRFVNLLTSDITYNALARLSISVGGAAANSDVYDYSAIYGGFALLKVVPALAFSPIPAIYTDGEATGLFVAVKSKDGAIGGTWPYADDAQFSLHIVPTSLTAGVVIEPSTLEFSKSQLSDPVQSFSIKHTNPRVFTTKRQYALQWLLRYAGTPTSSAVDITSIVSQDAQNVLLSRYQIIPKFPHVLSYNWQKASFNLSHIPVAHVSFTPRIPPVDGDSDVRGATTPAGRVDFEPPVLVAAPGQQIIEFKVKAQPGIDRDNLYYRVDWEVHGHADDLVNWVEWLQDGATGFNNGDQITFATWHLAPASATTVSVALIMIVCVLALARNMF